MELQSILILDDGSAVEELSSPALIIIQFCHGLTIVSLLFPLGRVIFVDV